MPASKKEVSIIGTGRLGTTLAVALERRGYLIRSLVARRIQNARRAASLLNAGTQVLAAKQLPALEPADLFLIATPDDEVAGVAVDLSKLSLEPSRKPTALHTSGALSAKVLAPLSKNGWHTGSMHPLISISDPTAGEAALRGAFWSVEGDKVALRWAKRIVRDLEGQSFSIRSEQKALYHAAAVMASGNVVALFDVAVEMLVQSGVNRKAARRILQPLVASAVKSLETKEPAAALTGTFSRGDVETVKRHLAALKDSELVDALELYRLLGKRSLKLTKGHSRITRILKSV